MSVDFRWNRSIDAITRDKLGGSDGVLFLANEAKRLMNPYVPADKLVLSQNIRTYVQDGVGVVEYISPYAHYQFEGEEYVDPKLGVSGFWIEGTGFRSRKGVAKKKSGRKLEYQKFRHPLATSHWDKAMMTARGDDLVTAVQNYVNRGAG